MNNSMKKVVSVILLVAMCVVSIFIPNRSSEAAAKYALNITDMTMSKGQSRQLKLSGAKKVTWKSSKKSVVTVSKKGKVTAKKKGSAVITAKSNGKSYKCNVTVNQPTKKKNDILIVYFSQTGTTKAVANKIQQLTGGDLLRIREKNKYSNDYDKTVARAKNELNKKSYPAISTKAFNMKSYDTVYVGYPVWWHSTPRVVNTFLKQYNLKGKTVIPFCTSGGSDISETLSALKKSCRGAKILKGYTADEGTKAEISNWLIKIGQLKSTTIKPTPTATVSATVEPTPTVTASATAEPTPTAIASATAEPTATVSATVEPTPTVTASATAEPTPTAIASATAEPTATVSATVEPTPTATVTVTVEPTSTLLPTSTPTSQPTAASKTLVVYFSMPETTDPDNMTQEEDNSVVVINGEVLGNTQYVAQVIQENTGADIFRIEPETPYPTDHETLVDLAKKEQNENARPAMKNSIENIDQYETIFIGYPNWWGDMPMIMYSFFDKYDLSGKTIIPFNTHGGSGFSNTIDTIAELEPNADVNTNGFTVSRNNVEEVKPDIVNWLKELGYLIEKEQDNEKNGKVLIAYYSATGSTRKVAETIAEHTGGDLFEITPKEIYTSEDLNWTNSNSRVCVEHDNPDSRHVELVTTEVVNFSEYDTVFIGYPIWWGIAAWPVDDFVKENDFTGKTVIPFCTSASSGIGESGNLLAKMAGTGEWQEGIRFNSSVSSDTVIRWIDGLDLRSDVNGQ